MKSCPFHLAFALWQVLLLGGKLLGFVQPWGWVFLPLWIWAAVAAVAIVLACLLFLCVCD